MDFARFPVMRDIFYLTAVFSRVSLVSTHHKLHLRKSDQSPGSGCSAGGGEAEEGAHPRPSILVGSCSSTQSWQERREAKKVCNPSGDKKKSLWHRRRDYSKNERSDRAALATEGTSN